MSTIVRFDSYEVDLPAGQLYKRGVKINLRDKSFQVSAALLEHPGEVVTRMELRRLLWRENLFVDFENNLNTTIGRLREALGDSADHPRFIETLPKRGYRFLARISKPSQIQEEKVVPGARLVVLPFVNLSGDPVQEYFSDAVTDEIITALSALAPEHLAVIARTTAMHYKGSHKDVARIGRELGVDYAVEGSVIRTDNRVRINLQLIRVSDQMHVFAKQYDAELRDIFGVQDSVAHAIASQIGITPVAKKLDFRVGVSHNATSKPTADLAAYNFYLLGRHHLRNLTRERAPRAKQYLEEAITRDPNFALPYDSLAELYWHMGFLGFMPPKEACSRGMFCALRAIEIDHNLADTHALLGMFRKQVDFDWPEVLREMALALQLNPTSPVVRLRYAITGLMPQGRLEEAAGEIALALESDPLSVNIRLWLSVMLWLGRHYERAIEEAQKILEIDPHHYYGHLAMGHVLCAQHVFDKAAEAFRKASELSGDSPQFLGWLGLALSRSGNIAESRSLIEHLHVIADHAYVPPTNFAWIHLGLGEIDSAFIWMDRAIDVRDHMMTPIKSYPFLDPLREDSRFIALLHKMNLEH